MRERNRRRQHDGSRWTTCRGEWPSRRRRKWLPDDPVAGAFNWPLVGRMDDASAISDQDNTPISEEVFRSVEARFILDQDGAKESLNKPTVGGLAWVMYRLLTGDPKWDAATTIEALRGAIKRLYRDHALP